MGSAYMTIIEAVIKQLENGIIPWKAAYNHIAKSHSTGQAYSLLNQLLLERPGEYWTFNQVQNANLRIRKGAKASRCVFWKILKVDKPEEQSKNIPYLRAYNVFHESDIEGLVIHEPDEIDADYDKADNIVATYLMMNPELELVEKTRITFPPSYSPKYDRVCIHNISDFKSKSEYYSTLFHELVHSTGHKNRLDRIVDLEDRTPDDYSKEELVAEIGASMLCSMCNIQTTIEGEVSYCANWANRLKDNQKWLLWAGRRAEEAIEYMSIGLEEEV